MNTPSRETLLSFDRRAHPPAMPGTGMLFPPRTRSRWGTTAGACLAACLLSGALLQAADEPYEPTNDTGPHDALVPKNTVPEPEDATAIVAATAVALLGGARIVRGLRARK